MSSNRIVGVVVLYQTCINDFCINLCSYISNVDLLFVVLNSPVDVSSLHGYDKIVIIENPHNFGIAKALNQGAEMALNRGYEWLLTMDQDSSFENDIFFRAFAQADKTDVAIFSPNHSIIRMNGAGDDYEESESDLLVMTSGNIISLSAWKKIGGFEEKLFIDEVDHDYCLRAIQHGFRIIKYPNVYLNHKLGDLKEVKFLFAKFYISQHSPTRTYYIYRNNLYVFRKYFFSFPFLLFLRAKELIKEFLRIILFQTNRKKHLFSIIMGIRDFCRGNYGAKQ